MRLFRTLKDKLFGKTAAEFNIQKDFDIPEGLYLSESEIITHLLWHIPSDDLDALAAMDPRDLIGLHHFFGRNIRNKYGLWHDANPYTDNSQPDGRLHADQTSQRIIEGLYLLLH